MEGIGYGFKKATKEEVDRIHRGDPSKELSADHPFPEYQGPRAGDDDNNAHRIESDSEEDSVEDID